MRKDLTGQRFGSLKVVSYSHTYKTPSNQSRAYWMCECDCGKIVCISANCLNAGKTKSCGCKSRELRKAKIPWMHGKSKTRLYNIWCGMHSRCSNKNRLQYSDYGGRGISVCVQWKDYREFEKWSLENGYNDTLTIERIDVNSDYCPNNCKWIPKIEQANNRRNSCLYTHNNETMTLKQWSERSGVKYTTLRARLKIFGWDFEKSISTPIGGNNNG